MKDIYLLRSILQVVLKEKVKRLPEYVRSMYPEFSDSIFP